MATADTIDEGYKPTESEAFMNERQRDYFRRKLLKWKEEILRESRETLAALQTENENHPDIADRASSARAAGDDARADGLMEAYEACVETSAGGGGGWFEAMRDAGGEAGSEEEEEDER